MNVVEMIDSEIARLQAARKVLSQQVEGNHPQTKHRAVPRKKHRKMSAEARKRIGDAVRKRWANHKKQKAS